MTLVVHFSSATPDWNTPPLVLALVREVFGAIDLDPCSNTGEPNVPAARHYTVADNGLAQPWDGKVYMNPPYGREIVPWVQKFVAEYRYGQMAEGIALVPARVDTAWFALLWPFPICFVRGRLKFSGAKSSAPFPSALVYAGSNGRRFAEVFGPLGAIVTATEVRS